MCGGIEVLEQHMTIHAEMCSQNHPYPKFLATEVDKDNTIATGYHLQHCVNTIVKESAIITIILSCYAWTNIYVDISFATIAPPLLCKCYCYQRPRELT